MEYLDGGTLKEFINKNKEKITEKESRIIINQLLKALSYLHYSCDICHRDIKPGNIMFSIKGDINSLKLLDFGVSSNSFYYKDFLDNCGTLKYMAPEQISNLTYSKTVDLWSVGIILYMLLNKGENPFYEKNDSKKTIIGKITNKKINLEGNKNISEMGKHLINKLLEKNPSYRYTAVPALSHPWVTGKMFDNIPLTVYDKIIADDYSEKLKYFLLIAIFMKFFKKKEKIMKK